MMYLFEQIGNLVTVLVSAGLYLVFLALLLFGAWVFLTSLFGPVIGTIATVVLLFYLRR